MGLRSRRGVVVLGHPRVRFRRGAADPLYSPMLIALLLVAAVGGAAAAAAVFGLALGRREAQSLVGAVDALDLVGGTSQVEASRLPRSQRAAADRINRLIAARRLAELAARDAAARARLGDGRSEQIAREIEPALDALRRKAGQWRARAEPAMREAFADVERELARLDDLMRGVIAVAAAAERPEASADLCAAVRAVVRDVPAVRAAALTLDLDERPCPVPGTDDAITRLAGAFLQHAVAAGAVGASGRRPVVGVFVRRLPRLQLEEPSVRRQTDPGLTIIPRRPNPRLERWLREGQPPAEVIKFIVADSGDGIPADIEKRLYDPAVGGGIGLTTARRVIEQARGTVWVQRAREGGAALHVVLPLAAVAQTNATFGDEMALRAMA